MRLHPACMLGSQGHCDGAKAAQRSEHNGPDNPTAISRTVLLLCTGSRRHRQIGEE
jgi:hypothetical protein